MFTQISLISLLCLMLIAQPNEPKVEYEYLPIVHFDRQPIVKGKINGKDAYFMLDSGSALSLLNAAAADNYGFGISPRSPVQQPLNGFGGRGEKPFYALNYKVELGSQTLKPQFHTYPLNTLFSNQEKYTPVGIIGSEVMHAYGFSIDFQHKRIRIKKLNS